LKSQIEQSGPGSEGMSGASFFLLAAREAECEPLGSPFLSARTRL
jgi:hypothetical protein